MKEKIKKIKAIIINGLTSALKYTFNMLNKLLDFIIYPYDDKEITDDLNRNHRELLKRLKREDEIKKEAKKRKLALEELTTAKSLNPEENKPELIKEELTLDYFRKRAILRDQAYKKRKKLLFKKRDYELFINYFNSLDPIYKYSSHYEELRHKYQIKYRHSRDRIQKYTFEIKSLNSPTIYLNSHDLKTLTYMFYSQLLKTRYEEEFKKDGAIYFHYKMGVYYETSKNDEDVVLWDGKIKFANIYTTTLYYESIDHNFVDLERNYSLFDQRYEAMSITEYSFTFFYHTDEEFK